MKIKEVRLGRIKVPLRVPFKTALRTVSAVDDIIVEIETDDGTIGYGEAPPTAVITGDTQEAICAAVRNHIAPAILGRDVEDFEPLMQAIQHSLVHNTSAKAMVDMACYDLFGKHYGIPVYRMLGGARSSICTDITISVNDPETMARDTLSAISRGYDTLKVKVGVNPSLDVERLRAVRNAAGTARIRIDANQAWRPREAVRILNEMQQAGLDIELVEQPVRAGDLEGLRFVTQYSDVPVLADESVFSPEDALEIVKTHAADLINIKLMKCGGIYPALQIVSLAEMCGVECMMGCMLEAKISVNAAVHLACARSVFTKIDLDGPVLCSEDPVLGGARFEEKVITAGEEPGLGIRGLEPGTVTWL